MEKIGLIAGNKKFPLIFAEAAKKNGYSIVAIAIKGDTSWRLKKFVDKIYWLGLDEFSRMFAILKSEGVRRVVMAGQVSPRRLFSKEIERDTQLRDLLKNIKNKKPDTIFGAVADKLKQEGFESIDSTTFIRDFLPQKSTLTTEAPDAADLEDVRFGFELAKAIAQIDLGQTVAVKGKAVIAVEGIEGTDNVIRRAGKIIKGAIIVKVSKPNQDMRFDIPVIGLNTIKMLVKARAKCLAIEAGKTLFIDKERSLKLANKHRIAIVAV